MQLEQDTTGSFTATWPAAVNWVYGTNPILSTATGRIDVVSFVIADDTNNILARLGGWWP